VKKLVLEQEGLDCLQSFLKGGSYLGRAASELIYDKREVITWLPDGTDLSKVSLKSGFGQSDAPSEDLWKPLAELTQEFLDQSSDHIAIVEAEYTHPVERLTEMIKACRLPPVAGSDAALSGLAIVGGALSPHA
jgi:hypothetical protein